MLRIFSFGFRTFLLNDDILARKLVRKTDKVYVESMKVVVLNKGDKVKDRRVKG